MLMSKMPAQQLLLSWKDHNGALVSVFENLLKKNTLVDCTLAAEGQYLKAHKVVLSACSSYFELLLSQESDKNPIVILKDVKFQELEAAVNFMYRGEVEVCEDRLAAFLEVADSLQIKGLGSDGRCQGSKGKFSLLKKSSTNSALTRRQQSGKEVLNPRSDFADQSSNVPADSEHIRNNEISSVNQSSRKESSPTFTVSTFSVGSSSTARKETLRDSDSFENIRQSSALPSFTSGESVQCEGNPIIKTEPETDSVLGDQSDGGERDFGDDVTMLDDQDDCDERNTETMDAVPFNEQVVGCPSEHTKTKDSTSENVDSMQPVNQSSSEGAVWIQSDDQQKFFSIFVKEEVGTSGSWNQEAVAYASGDGTEPIASTSAASTDAGWILPDEQQNLSSLLMKEEPGTSVSWNQEVVAYGVSGSSVDVKPSFRSSAASAGVDNLGIEDIEHPTSASVQFYLPVASSTRSNLSRKSAEASLQRTTPRPPFKKFFCPNCKEAFIRVMDLKRHTQLRNCGRSEGDADPLLPQPLRLRKAVRQSSKRGSLKCSECNYVARFLSQLTRHRRIHTGERPFKCSHCDYAARYNWLLKKHLITHAGERSFRCRYCRYEFKQKRDLIVHLHTHSRRNSNSRKFKCEYCDYATERRWCLLVHLSTHTGGKTFKCPHCDYASVVRGNLAQHLRTHTGAQRFKCMVCEAKFRTTRSLIRHEKRAHNK